MPLLRSKEVEVLQSIFRDPSISQRELAKKTLISLGLINVIIKKFIKIGYIKVCQINKRKMEYTLTPNGLQETARKNHYDTAETIKKYKSIQLGVANLLKELHQSGYDYFSIHGDGELRDLIETTFYNCLENAPVSLGKEHHFQPRAVILNLTPEPLPENPKGNVVDILDKLSLIQ